MVHTPGPWSVSEENGSIYVVEERGYHVANVYRMAANALLIAAAPEMLEALKALLDSGDYIDEATAWDMVHAAIAKAEGVA